MAIQINGNGTITGINVGGLPNGIVDTDMLAANAVSSAKLASGAITAAAMPSGSIIQYKYAVMSGGEHNASSTSDEDVPNMSVDIAKTNASNLIVCEVTFTPYFGGSSTLRFELKIKRDSTTIYNKPYGLFRDGTNWKSSQSICRKVDTGANDTNSHTYKFVTKRITGNDTCWFDDDGVHTITVMEVVA